MTERKVTFYADYEIIEDIALTSEKYPKLTEIFHGMSNICLNISKNKLQDMQKITSEGVCNPVWQFFQDKDIPTPIALDSFFQQNDDDVYLFDPTAVFLLNKSESQTKVLREKYGVLILGSEEVNDDILQLNHKKKKGIDKKDSIFGLDRNGWKTIIQEVPVLNWKPLNAAIVSDNYLMRNDEKTSKGICLCGPINLLRLFDSILPSKLSIPFQILIVCPDNSKVPNKANESLNDFALEVKRIRDYPIEVEYCLSSKTPVHHRRIFTNYYTITCEKGFSMFKVNPGNKVRDDGNDVRIESYYHDPIYTSGDLAREDAYDDLIILKDIYTKEMGSSPKNRLLE